MSTSTTSSAPTTGRRSFADLSVRLKVLAAVVVAVMVAVVVGLLGLNALSHASTAAQDIYGNNLASVEAIGVIDGAMTQVRSDVANQALSDPAGTEKYTEAVTAGLRTVDAGLATYTASHPAGDPAVISDLEASWRAYAQIVQTKQLASGRANDLKAWQVTRDTEVIPVMTKVNSDIDALVAAETASAASAAAGAKADYQSSRIRSIALLVLGSLLALALGLLVARAIVRSLARVRHVCDGLAAGDLTRTTGLTTRDEPGQMGRALDTAVARLRGTVSTIDGSAASLASASEEMSGVAGQIATSAQQTTAQAQAVSAAAEQISRSVITVSAGSEQMGASIREISLNATEAALVAAEAVTITATTSATMTKLDESSTEIGNVIKVITAIAQQTNLLALNATIEAARAGEMGKGFAVVASEVKDLAQETARATEDISRRVQAIQGDTTGAVTAIEEISRVIARISDFQTTIASAVEEQTATTAEMNRSVAEASTGTAEIAENITGVAQSASLTSQGIAETQQAIGDLARMSSELNTLVGSFRY
jgi:methyl-accepting chemotaxis protein